VLPPEGTGWYVGHAQSKQHGVRHQSFKEIERLVRWLEFWDGKGFDCYFAVAAFELEKVYDAQPDGTFKQHRRSRKNLPILMNFHQDIDTQITHGKAHYADQEEAASAVLSFAKAHRLPAPLWVSSGGGLHTYWHLSRHLSADEWQPLASGLKQAMLDFGVRIGPERAADPASILRVPGFHHWKTGNVVTAGGPVIDLDPAAFEQFRGKGHDGQEHRRARHAHHAALPAGSLAAAVAGGILDGDSDIKIIRARCRQLAAYAANPGSFGEPFSRAVAALARECGDESWTEYLGWLGTEWRGIAQAKADGWTGSAPLCTTFRNDGGSPSPCDLCPVKGQVTSPIQVGRDDFLWPQEAPQAVGQGQEKLAILPWASANGDGIGVHAPAQENERSLPGPHGMNGFPALSSPWALFDGRLVYVTENKGDPVRVAVSGHPLYVDAVHSNEATGHSSITLKHKLPHEAWTTINIGAEMFSDARFHGELMRHHVLVFEPKLLKQYIIEQVEKFNRDNAMRSTRYEQFGWKGIDTETPSFLHGATLHCPGPLRLPAVTNDELMLRVRNGLMPMPGGSARDLVSVMNQLFPPDHYVAWFSIIASFTSLCHAFFDRTSGGTLINLVGPTGRGKTNILRAGAAVWGKWDALAIKHYDTPPSIGLTLAGLGNLPAFIDEVHHFALDPQFGVTRLRSFVDMFNAGTDKHRAMQFGTGVRAQQARWAMNAFATSNQSIIDLVETGTQMVDGVAATMRMIELPGEPPRQFDSWLGSSLQAGFDANAGHAGDAFLHALMQPGVLKQFRETLARNKETLWKLTKLGPEQRYRIYTLAGVATAGPILRDLGLIPAALDQSAMLAAVLNHVKERSPAPETYLPSVDMAVEALHQFFSANTTNTLRVQHPYKSGLVQLPIGQKPQQLVIRHEFSSGRAYAAAREFKRFVVVQGYPYAEVVAFLRQVGVLKNDKRWITLGAGTEYASAQVPCIELDIANPAVAGLIEDQYGAPTGEGGSAEPGHGSVIPISQARRPARERGAEETPSTSSG
jgi:hypothetical protein